MTKIITLVALTIFSATNAVAQTTIPNPLHRYDVQKQEPQRQEPHKQEPHKQEPQKQSTVVATAPTEPATIEKPKRERSAKQKQSDSDMRTCGKSWGDSKDELKAKGETWRSYLKTCRAQLKATRGA